MEGDVGVQLATLESLQASSKVIVLTNSFSSKGVDFVFAVPQAYVIHTLLPLSVVKLKQDSGRGTRGGNNELPVVGAVFTEKPYQSIQQLELGLEHMEQFDKLYPADYIQSLKLLEKLPAPTTESQNKAILDAISSLNEGGGLTEISTILAHSPVYKKLLPANPKQSSFTGKPLNQLESNATGKLFDVAPNAAVVAKPLVG